MVLINNYKPLHKFCANNDSQTNFILTWCIT
nr:unnamed protein product [Callosobruchus chinensis]